MAGELWNVELEDEGALAVASLACGGAAAEKGRPPSALQTLNLGRNLISIEARETIEARVVEGGSGVRVRIY